MNHPQAIIHQSPQRMDYLTYIYCEKESDFREGRRPTPCFTAGQSKANINHKPTGTPQGDRNPRQGGGNLKEHRTGNKPGGNQQTAKAPTNQEPAEMPQELATMPARKHTGPKHISIDTLLNYRLQGLSYAEIGKLTGCSNQNVCDRLANFDIDGFESYKKAPDVSLERFCYQYISLIGEPEIKNMIAKRGMTDFGIALDKVREIRGQNDSNIKPMIVIVKGDNAQVQVNGIAKPSSTLATQVIDTTSNDVSNE